MLGHHVSNSFLMDLARYKVLCNFVLHLPLFCKFEREGRRKGELGEEVEKPHDLK